MRRSSLILTAGLFLATTVLAAYAIRGRITPVRPEPYDSTFTLMRITSPAFEEGRPIPKNHTCDGPDLSPELRFSDVPTGAVSVALVVHDPDAPSGDWLHWTVWNVPADAGVFPEGSVPEGGIQGRTDFGKSEYGGPCPPSGTHHYVFDLYALDTLLDLGQGAPLEELMRAMEDHVIAKATLTGTYAREGER